MSVQERVARGARWLDEVSPWWRDAMALRTFDLANGCRCVLGQVFAEAAAPSDGYTYALGKVVSSAELLACRDWPAAHGFALGWSLEDALRSPRDELAQLEAEWCSVIHGRRDELATCVRC
jgi:hypothetical protein